MQCSGKRYRTITSTALVGAIALGMALASFTRPDLARAADPKPAAATGKPAKPAVDKQAVREKRKSDAAAKRSAARAKKSDKRAREDREDLAAKHPWIRGADWLGFRAGTAGASSRGRPNPGPAFGFGYQHFTSRRWALGVQVDYDLLGKYAGAAEIEVPMHLELTRHYDWGEAMRPYFGLSAGGTWHRTYRTGGDAASMRPSLFFVGGANMPVGPRVLMGADLRLGWEKDARSDDPVFPTTSRSLLTWRAKLAYLRWQ